MLPERPSNIPSKTENIRRKTRKDKITYCERINDTALWCKIVYDEVDKMTLIVVELPLSIQTVIAPLQKSKNQRKLSYEGLVHYSQDEEDSRWARLQWRTEFENK